MSTDESNELIWKPATEQARLIRDGDLSSRELTAAYLARVEQANPTLNAIVTLTADRAMTDAAAADQAHADGDQLGILHGLVTAHKDLANTAGVRTTMGSPLFADNVPGEDALIVTRAKAAGAISIGKTNTPEFGAGSQTFNSVFGATRNPYDTGRTCGGSSGGAAVAAAAAMVSVADGSDMGGSLRNPASFCNIVGFRPSPGRVPSSPNATPWGHLATSGPMARTVDDVALLLAAQAGPDPRSPIAFETTGRAFLPPLADPPAGLRVAWAPDLGGLPVDAAVTDALAGVPGVFADLGHAVDEACPDLSGAAEVFDTLRAWSFAVGLGDLVMANRDQAKDTVIWNIERGLNLSIEDHMSAFKTRAAIYGRVAEFFGEQDILLAPVAQVPPFPIDVEYITEIAGQEMSTYIEWMRVCTDVTVMNVPAISVPAGFTPEGLPIGLQIIGPPRADQLVLQVARQFEQATRVGLRRPVI